MTLIQRMKASSIVLIPFPFSDLKRRKLRPALVIGTTKDEYEDVILCAISSIVPDRLLDFQILVKSSNKNGLRVDSIIRVDRIMTIQKEDVVVELGVLEKDNLDKFKRAFKKLVDF